MEGQWNSFQSGRFKGAILIQTAADLDRAIQERKYGVLFYCQSHYKLEGGVTNIRNWYAKGLRVFQLQYGGHDGNQGPDEKLGSGTDQAGGLTPLGKKVVRELARLHMVIDLSHCNEATILDTAKIAKELGVPITANHSGARGVKLPNGKYLARYARNMTDKAMKVLADTGGVVAVMAYGPYVRGPYQKVRYTPPTRNIQSATVHDYVAHIDYMVSASARPTSACPPTATSTARWHTAGPPTAFSTAPAAGRSSCSCCTRRATATRI
jgi:microsomal dipeptidase-like Zn-dependent dipeptidase